MAEQTLIEYLESHKITARFMSQDKTLDADIRKYWEGAEDAFRSVCNYLERIGEY